jgi:putative membrane protein
MKLLSNQHQWNANTKLTLALCTVLALSGAAVNAADDKDKGQGGTGSASQSQTGTSGQSGKSGQLSRTDEQFVRQAARSGNMEVHMGKMGTQKAQNSQVKQFAQKLVDDHGKANSELQQIASRKGITLPQPREGITGTDSSTSDGSSSDSSAVGAPGGDSGTSTSSDSQRPGRRGGTIISSDPSQSSSDMKKLHSLSGTDFDREYVSLAAKHHQKSVQNFEQASKTVEDQELKAWIEKTLPTLKEHLQTAQSLQTTVGGAGAPGSDTGASSGSSGNASTGTGTSSGTSTTDQSK